MNRKKITDPTTGLRSNAVLENERFNVSLNFEVTKLTTRADGVVVQEKYMDVPGYNYYGMNYALMSLTEQILAQAIKDLADLGTLRGVLSSGEDAADA